MTAGWPPLNSIIWIPALAAGLCMGPWFARRRDQSGRLCKLWALCASVLTALRQKLGETSECVETVRGVGYRFADTREDGE